MSGSGGLIVNKQVHKRRNMQVIVALVLVAACAWSVLPRTRAIARTDGVQLPTPRPWRHRDQWELLQRLLTIQTAAPSTSLALAQVTSVKKQSPAIYTQYDRVNHNFDPESKWVPKIGGRFRVLETLSGPKLPTQIEFDNGLAGRDPDWSRGRDAAGFRRPDHRSDCRWLHRRRKQNHSVWRDRSWCLFLRLECG